MARHFVRLKLTLLAAGLRLSWRQLLGFVLSIVAAVPLSVGGFALLAWLGGEAAGGSGLRLVFAILTLLWIVGPPLLFGVDETLDPARLRLLPLSRRELAQGLLAASAIGVGPLGTLVALLGAIAGFARGLGAVVVVAAVAVQFALCLVAARAVTTVLSRWLRSRRGQDVLVLAGAGVGLGFAALGQLPNLFLNVIRDYRAFAEALDRVEAVVGALPLAWAGSAVIAASEGRLLAGLGWLAASGALVAGLGALWMRALTMSSTAAPPASRAPDRPLFSGLASVLPRNRLGAAAAKELRYQWRVPQLRAQWIFLPLLGVALVAGAFLLPGDASPLLVFGVCGVVGFGGFSAINAFGGDRGAVWLLVAAGGVERADIAGKNLAGAIVLLPSAGVLALVLAALSGGWVYVPAALGGAVAVLGCAYGVGNLVSVVAPAPLPDSLGNIWGNTQGAGCATGFAQALAAMAGAVLLLPVIAGVASVAAFAPALLAPAGFAAAAYGMGVWWLGLVFAARIAEGRGPELVAALSGSS